MSNELRDIRDTLRTRLSLVEKRTSAKKSFHRVHEKFNARSPKGLPELFQLQAGMHRERVDLIDEQIKRLDRTLNGLLLNEDDVQRLLWIPGIGRINAWTIFLEINGIERCPTVNNFYSYCRLVPGKVFGRHLSGDPNRCDVPPQRV